MIEHTCATLALPPPCADVLSAFLPLELDADTAAQVRADDPHGRPGVLPWSELVAALGGATVEMLEAAVTHLSDWGLLQLVGLQATDPPVSGAAAIRLTYAGRACIGLAPARRHANPPSGAPLPWKILHGASREGLLVEAWHELGHAEHQSRTSDVPLPLRGEPLDHLCGQIAVRLVCSGEVIVDGFALAEPDALAGRAGAAIVEALLVRTATANTPRLLLLPEPAIARVAASCAGAEFRWCEPRVEARRQGLVLDERLGRRLQNGRVDAAVVADLTGVPDSELAMPRRVNTAWADMLLPAGVEQEFRQALMHARYRMQHDPAQSARPLGYRLLLSGLPGTGKSMAAEALATTLGRPLVKLDLSSVLSKWLGETEKLMAQVFDVAEAAGAVLVLDEAEALLRQRESGSQGNHALATGVAYLLTRLERFTGLLVATTNRTKDLDEAFFRRFDDYIVLPIPDDSTRALLWRRHLGLESQTNGIDVALLARRFAISGGLIRGAGIRARAWAAGMDEPLSTPVALASLGRELEKSDRSSSEVFIEPYAARVRQLMRGTGGPPVAAGAPNRAVPTPGR